MLDLLKKTAVAAAVAFVVVPAAASAVTVSFTGGTGGDAGTVLTGNGSVKQNLLGNGTANVDFNWLNTSPGYLAYSEFTTNAAFRLTFQDYSPEFDLLGAAGARSGFQIYAGSFGGSLTPLLPHTPNTEPACGTDVNSNFGSTDCVLVTGAGNEGTPFIVPPITFDIAGGAGTYVLMFSEGNQPNNGSAEFIISAVPLPAGGLLLLGALGGLAALRRRKQAA